MLYLLLKRKVGMEMALQSERSLDQIHHIGNLLSMDTQPLIKSFQMLHRGKSNLEQSAVAPTEFMDLQDLWKLLGATGLKQTPLRKAAQLDKDKQGQTKLCDIHLRAITRNDARAFQLAT